MSGIIVSPRESEKSIAIKSIIAGSSPNREYYILVALSVMLATLAILMRNDTVLIGSMLVAPLLYPLLAIALGAATIDRDLTIRSTMIVLQSLMLSVSTAATTTLVFNLFIDAVEQEYIVEYIVTTFTPSYMQVAVGVVAGLAASFALTKESLANAIPGAAIAVALIPPLAATGVSIAYFNLPLVLNSTILFSSNIVGIVVASSFFFMSMNFSSQNSNIDRSLKEEERDLKLDS